MGLLRIILSFQPETLSEPSYAIPDTDDVYATLRKKNAQAAELAQHFDVPSHLTNRSAGLASLLLAYKQWNAYHALTASIKQAVLDGTFLATPKAEDVKEVFAAKSTFYKTYIVGFTPVNDHPELRKWLDQADDAPSGSDLFGVSKSLYTFADLARYYAGVKAKQGKRVQKDVEAKQEKRMRKGNSEEEREGKKGKKGVKKVEKERKERKGKKGSKQLSE